MDEVVTSLDERRNSQTAGLSLDSTKRPPDKRRFRMGDPNSAIRRLKCFSEVHDMICAGRFLREIIDFIHTEGELRELSRSAVRVMLQRYKSHVFSDNSVLDGDIKKGVGDDDDPIRALHVLERSLRQMEERIDMEVAVEKQLSKLFSTTHYEYLAQLSIAREILKRRGDLGLLKKERGGIKQRVGSGTPGRIDVAQVIANPESRQKILGLVEALVKDPELLGRIPGRPSGIQGKKKNRKKRRRNDH